jgi:hypothetical protein
VATLKYVGMTENKSNCIHEENKSRLHSGNGSYHSVQNILSSRPLSETVKTKLSKTTALPVVFYECETWSLLTLREENRLRGFQNRVLRRISGSKREEEV